MQRMRKELKQNICVTSNKKHEKEQQSAFSKLFGAKNPPPKEEVLENISEGPK